jgi:hypothetical protein
MKFFWRFWIGLLAITGAVAVATGLLGVEFGHYQYWDHHGILFLIFITAFPRLTLLFSSVPTGGLLWWLSWLFAPRILVAVLATLNYWYQNPILVVISWLIALGGESSEKYVMVRRSRSYSEKQKGYESAKWVDAKVDSDNSRR